MTINRYQLASQGLFCSLHSTLTAFLEAKNSWSVNIDNSLPNEGSFIELNKKFNTIAYHDIILRKMSYFRC